MVLATVDNEGVPCVLKIAMVLDADGHERFTRSALVHQLADGVGCARLLAVDERASALLLERLGPNLAELELPLPALLDAVCSTLQSFWRPTDSIGLRTGPDQIEWLATFIPSTWAALGRPCDRSLVDRALALCHRRHDTFDASRAVLGHGDAHGWNTLDAGDGSYRFVDPEGCGPNPNTTSQS